MAKPKEPEPRNLTRRELAAAPARPAADARPNYLAREAGAAAAGFENMDQQDRTLPRLGLCQSMSPQRKKSDPKFIHDLEEGMFFNTITREVYGEKVNLTPLLFYKSRILFNPVDEGGGIRCQAPDGRTGQGDPGGECARCPLAQFTKDEKPACSLFFNYPALVLPDRGVPGLDSIVVVSFKSSGLKVSRDWNALMTLRNADMFAGAYELSSVEMKNSQGTWFQPVVKNAEWVSKEAFEVAKIAYAAMRDAYAAGRLRADVSDLNPGERSAPETAEM